MVFNATFKQDVDKVILFWLWGKKTQW